MPDESWSGCPSLEKNSEEVVAAGAIIVCTVIEALGMSQVLVSELGLREGVLIYLAKRSAER